MSVEKKFKEILVEIYSDPDLAVVFEGNPRGFLKVRGIDVPEGIELRVLEDTAKVRHIVIPHLEGKPPATAEELEERLSLIVTFV
jgi:hypothetical protein